jgi:hemolysin activation/secretion protein
VTFTFKLTDPLGWKFLYLVSISAQLALPAWASAQTLPDAGILQQQIDRGRQQALPPPALPSQAARPTESKPPQGVTLEVKRFKFAGNSLLPDQTLAAAVAGFLNRPIDFAQLQDAAAAAANRYRDAGWVVRVYIPEQDFVDGQVTIQIVEAVFGKLVQDGPASARVPPGLIERIVGAQLKPGDRIKTDAIDRAILLANDLAGITATGSLQEGSQDSQSDLLVKTVDLAVLQGDASLDNLGSRSTGSQRASANLSANSLLNRGELLTANAIATAGSKYLRLAAAMPLGGDGLRLGLNASRLN